MTRRTTAWIAPLAACLLLSAAPLAVAGDPPATGSDQKGKTASQQGPLTLERVKAGFVFAPDVKITRFDGGNRTLVGGYAGLLHDGQFLIGVGAYTLANGTHDRNLTYGGLVVGYTAPLTSALQVGLRGLFGGGEARITETIYGWAPDRPHILGNSRPAGWVDHDWAMVEGRARFREAFAVAEPQAEVVLRLSRWLAVGASGGYRLVAGSDHGDSRLRGATGSLSVRIGSGF